MARNAWRVWGVSAAIAGSLAAADKPADLPVRSEVVGKSTPAVTQEHFQGENAPPPRLLPNPILDDAPPKPMQPTATIIPANLVGVQTVATSSPDIDVPISAVRRGGIPEFRFEPTAFSFYIRCNWQAVSALDVAELHFRSCDREEARRWYQEVIRLAPGGKEAAIAAERLKQTDIIPAGATESREPPLADAQPARGDAGAVPNR